jgi:hypothetical protein
MKLTITYVSVLEQDTLQPEKTPSKRHPKEPNHTLLFPAQLRR